MTTNFPKTFSTTPSALREALCDVKRPIHVGRRDGEIVLLEGTAAADTHAAFVPACCPENLGDPSFCRDHGLTFPYVAGAMANGIGSTDIVSAMGQAGLLGIFGAGGLAPAAVEAAISRMAQLPEGTPGGINLIHSPAEPELERACTNLFIRNKIRLIEASAFMGLTLQVVRYRLHEIHSTPDGAVVTPNRVIAKVSRVEVAEKFLSPAPDEFVGELVRSGELTEEQARLSKRVPVAQDLTAEADSGGHTDNRPAIAMIPTMTSLRDRLQRAHHFNCRLRVGAAGGISTPASAMAAFAMGAAYVVTGSVNQACVESGSSDIVRQMLAEAGQADITMAPAADMFELGVKLQVLKRGTLFPMRAAKLYELYRAYRSLEEIPANERANLEKKIFRNTIDEVWAQTRAFFEKRDPSQILKAEQDTHHRMALVFRWYLGQSSAWANRGEPSRRMDYQIWCGPAMGAFNEWVKGSFLEQPANRNVVTIGLNILYGAAVQTRIHILRLQGIELTPELARFDPIPEDALQERL